MLVILALALPASGSEAPDDYVSQSLRAKRALEADAGNPFVGDRANARVLFEAKPDERRYVAPSRYSPGGGMGLLGVMLGFLVAFAAFKLIVPARSTTDSPHRQGRKWTAWGVAFAICTYLPNAIGRPGVDSLAYLLFALGACGTLAYGIGYLVGLRRKRTPQMTRTGAGASRSSDMPSAVNEDALFEKIGLELESGDLDRGGWTRALAEADGDERLAKARYIRWRMQMLRRSRGIEHDS